MKLECIFLDRDGVINQERADYVKSWEEFELLPGSIEAVAQLSQLNIPIILITNQSAIGRGAASREAVDAIHNRLLKLIQERGGRLDEVFLCPHHPGESCECRKPKPGMLLQAAQKYQINLNRAVFVGDAITDYQAALAAGCSSILLKSGRQALQIETLVAAHLQTDAKAVRPEIFDNLSSAVQRILTMT